MSFFPRASVAVAVASVILLELPSASAQTAITITNPGFESPSTGSFADLSGWSGGASVTGVLNFANFGGEYAQGSAPEGNQVGYANSGNSIFQDLGATYTSGFTYTLTVMVGRRSTSPSAVGTFDLMRGTTLLASSGNIAPASATFSLVTVNYTATGADAGQAIRIQFNSAGTGQMNFDNVQLSAIPEPSTYAALLGMAALGAVGVRRWQTRKFSGDSGIDG
jgi:hypothetical protein